MGPGSHSSTNVVRGQVDSSAVSIFSYGDSSNFCWVLDLCFSLFKLGLELFFVFLSAFFYLSLIFLFIKFGFTGFRVKP